MPGPFELIFIFVLVFISFAPLILYWSYFATGSISEKFLWSAILFFTNWVGFAIFYGLLKINAKIDAQNQQPNEYVARSVNQENEP